MGLLSGLKRKAVDSTIGAAGAGEPADGVARARTRARQRLIGAVVLVAAGIIGFPMVFETQPRPIPVDIAIEIPKKDAVPPLAVPGAPLRGTGSAAAAVVEPVAPAADDIVTESRAEAGRELPLALPEGAAARPAAAAAPGTDAPTRNGVDRAGAASKDAARAQALLDGKDAAKADAGRFIVQVGAFAEAAAARDARLKIERLGLKTYTQVAETPDGSRIRVRLGPFASRDDADKALAKARAAGLAGVVLVL